MKRVNQLFEKILNFKFKTNKKRNKNLSVEIWLKETDYSVNNMIDL